MRKNNSFSTVSIYHKILISSHNTLIQLMTVSFLCPSQPLLSLMPITLCRYSQCPLCNVVFKGLFTVFSKIMTMSNLLS